ncbi:hypothetical protein ACQUW5_09300 [Legionella sp. CNM-1927-20]|uniref:hypothetical protein n=1 Tax=Legionella sp. CNM-1927-20 TaxID=3422221 RepID=UPI00403AC135
MASNPSPSPDLGDSPNLTPMLMSSESTNEEVMKMAFPEAKDSDDQDCSKKYDDDHKQQNMNMNNVQDIGKFVEENPEAMAMVL